MTLPDPSVECTVFLKKCCPADEESFLRLCAIYGEYLYSINESLNLTSIPPEFFWSKHVADSLSAACFFSSLREMRGLRLCDLGCGGGLPSLILAAAFPDVCVFAVDSRGKKVEFVRAAAEKMGLENLTAIHARGNELGRQKEFHKNFDMVTARAVSDAKTLIHESASLLKREGSLIIYRTPAQAESEIEVLKKETSSPKWELTSQIELPDAAGSRLFLTIFPNVKLK